jgi:hypothetical protein
MVIRHQHMICQRSGFFFVTLEVHAPYISMNLSFVFVGVIVIR